MKKFAKRAAALLLAMVLCLGALPLSAAAGGDALPLSEVKVLLNREKLYPQRTGYPAIDKEIEKILAPYEGKDTYTKIKALYDWTVNQVHYSWNGYSQTQAPAYDKFTLRYDLEYETGLPQAYPKDMINRAYHMLTARTGVCYDWGILFAVMARYVGIESYVHTGILYIGDWSGHHGWTELKLGGKNYIFDAQQDNRELADLGHPDSHDHFGVPTPAARWEEYDSENDPRDASMLPVTAERIRRVTVTAQASPAGSVTGGGTVEWEKSVTLKVVEGSKPLTGWYDASGKLLGNQSTYSFIPKGNVTVYAMFEGDRYADIDAAKWYYEDVCAAAEKGFVYGTSSCTFTPSGKMSRAMLITVLAKAAGMNENSVQPAPFTDVENDKWYAAAVNWAYANGIAAGVSKTKFDPDKTVTREQAATMLVKYLETQGKQGTTAAGTAEFTDAEKISAYAVKAMVSAQSLGLISGYQDGTVRPGQSVTRAEGVTMIMNMLRCLEVA